MREFLYDVNESEFGPRRFGQAEVLQDDFCSAFSLNFSGIRNEFYADLIIQDLKCYLDPYYTRESCPFFKD